jgi:hypothetical protein
MRKITFGNPFEFGRFKPHSDNEHNPGWHLEWNCIIKHFAGFISKASSFTYGIAKDKVAIN